MRNHAYPGHRLIAIGSLIALLSAITCGGDVVVDDPPEGSAGDGQGATGTGNQGNTGNQGATGNQGGQGNTGNVAQGGQGNVGNEGSGGASFCHTCAQEIQCQQGVRDPTTCRSEFCPGSDQLFDALAGCVCGFCSMECFSTCQGGPPEPGCSPCQTEAISGPCSIEFNDCANDF